MFLKTLSLGFFSLEIAKLYDLFEGLIFSPACSVHLVRQRFWAISTESQRSRSNRRQTKFSGPQKGPAERGHVKKRQKSSKSVKNIFDTFRHFSRREKTSTIVKKCQTYFRHFSTIFAFHRFSGPFWGPLTNVQSMRVKISDPQHD